MNVSITPTKLNGSINVIASKSCLHRAIIAASLSTGVSVIDNILYSKDVIATINACISLGANIKQFDTKLEIEGISNLNNNIEIDCNESGSTLRFMIPVALCKKNKVKFTGKQSLLNRPLCVYYDLFDEMNIEYKDFLFEGELIPGEYTIQGNVSSQFLTGLLFSMPLLNKDSIIKVDNLESRGYIDLTIDILKKFNIEISNKDYKEFIIKGNQQYKSCNYTAEADYSQASFFIVANELGNNIKISDLNLNSFQPDKKIIDDINNIKQNKNITLKENPDCGPILSVLASLHNVSFLECNRLRIKECDRVTAIVNTLSKLGANVMDSNDKIMFKEVSKLNGNIEIDCYNDHRIAMMLAIASTICECNIKLLNANCVEKSYPNFWDDFKSLGGIINVE